MLPTLSKTNTNKNIYKTVGNSINLTKFILFCNIVGSYCVDVKLRHSDVIIHVNWLVISMRPDINDIFCGVTIYKVMEKVWSQADASEYCIHKRGKQA